MLKSLICMQQVTPNTPIAFTLFAMRGYLKWFLLATIFITAVELILGFSAIILQEIVDSANLYAAGEGLLKTVFLWTLALPVLRVSHAILIRAVGFAMHYLTIHTRTRTVRFLFEYISNHSLSYFSDRFAGSLGSRVTTISKNVNRLLGQFLYRIVGTFTGILISIALIFSINISLAIAVSLSFLLLIPFNLFLTRKQVKLSERMSKTSAKLRGLIIDTVTNITAVQQYARKDFELEKIDGAIVEHRTADLKSDYYREFVLLINNIIGGIIIIVATWWVFILWSEGSVTLGQFVLMMTITGKILFSLTFIGQWLNDIMESYGELKDGLKEIIVPHEIVNAPNAKELIVKSGAITFDDATFKYGDANKNLFTKLYLQIKPGEKIGVVGKSGVGKTTLMKMLLRQHNLDEGKITIDDQDISNVTLDSLREKIGIVPQEPFLFHRTIEENILYGNPNASKKDVIEAAKNAQAHEFIELLPKKYKTTVGERGVKLSVGQRQRLAIARVFLKNAPILILDEATSALDSESEIAVQKALGKLIKDKTVFAIAHRLSTLREMDRILVFKNGKIVQDGTHEDLLDKDGLYAELWSHQAEGFIAE